MLKGRHFIDGKWWAGSGSSYLESINPASGKVIGKFVEGTRHDAARAAAAANGAQPSLARMTVRDRSALCLKIADAVERKKEELARILALEQGKPFKTEAMNEVIGALQAVREAAEQVKWLESSSIPVANKYKTVFTVRKPRGVYAVITPWNFPVSIPLQYIGPALAAGNSIVWVPAPSTSLVAVKLMEIISEADLPRGAVNLVTGRGDVVGDEIVVNPATVGIAFTGSPTTGKTIAQRGAGKALLLELGGNGPTIILDDADLERATIAAAGGCFYNAGQVCASTERLLVQEKVYDEVVERVREIASQHILGDPFDERTTMGPLNNEEVASKVDKHITDAVNKGAKVVLGGKRRPELGSGLFYEPTVITDIPVDSLFQKEETFGPVAPIIRFASDEEAVSIANNSGYGLTSGIFTRNMARAMRFAETVNAGIFNINEAGSWWEPHIPFGGASGTKSGVGRLGGRHTLEEMTDLKTISIDNRGFD